MLTSKLIQIGPRPGFTPQIGHLVAMMEWARYVTLETVAGLTQPQLDHLVDERSNSIGALLLHMAEVEREYQMNLFEGRHPDEAEAEAMKPALELGDLGRERIKGKPLEHYLERLSTVRAETLRQLALRSDDWLYEELPFWDDEVANNYFVWYHVFEDEINHRGQISWLRKRIPKRSELSQR